MEPTQWQFFGCNLIAEIPISLKYAINCYISSDHLVKVNEHPAHLRTEGEGAIFKLVVKTADEGMIVSQDGGNHHLVPT